MELLSKRNKLYTFHIYVLITLNVATHQRILHSNQLTKYSRFQGFFTCLQIHLLIQGLDKYCLAFNTSILLDEQRVNEHLSSMTVYLVLLSKFQKVQRNLQEPKNHRQGCRYSHANRWAGETVKHNKHLPHKPAT